MKRLWQHLTRDRRNDDPNRPDWQELVDAVDLAADIAVPKFGGGRRAHVIRFRRDAEVIADAYEQMIRAGNIDVEAIDGELFRLQWALDTYPNDVFGRGVAVQRFGHLLRKEPSRLGLDSR